MEARMTRSGRGGFVLLEVVVALGLLAVSTLLIAEALGAAIEYARAADLARRATAAAAAVAATSSERLDSPAGWRAVGTPGADGLPGTRDDGPPDSPEPECRRRVLSTVSGGVVWTWVESSCSPGIAGEGKANAMSGGRLGRSAVLARVR
jgi:type II secretory pathway pseudopilin PulG